MRKIAAASFSWVATLSIASNAFASVPDGGAAAWKSEAADRIISAEGDVTDVHVMLKFIIWMHILLAACVVVGVVNQKWQDMPTLKPPIGVKFLVSLIVIIFAWISSFAHIPVVGEHPAILLSLAYAVLVVSCFV